MSLAEEAAYFAAVDAGRESAQEEIDDLRQQLADAKAALNKYGWHTGDCSRRMRQFREPCKCGFDAAIRKGEGV